MKTLINVCGASFSGTTISTTVSQSAASTHRYVAVVCNGGGANAQAVSIPVVVAWS